VLMNLSACFPEARIMIVIRRQDALAKSFYRQYLKSGGTRRARRFFGFEPGRQAVLALDRFRFSPYLDALHARFPSGVLVLVYEELLEQPRVFLKKICDYIGVSEQVFELRKENATNLGPIGMEVSRLLNFCFRSQLNPAGFIPGVSSSMFGAKRRLSPVQLLHEWPLRGRLDRGECHEMASLILETFKEDNAALDRRYRLGLQEYGYY
jgi:hypothetical protein